MNRTAPVLVALLVATSVVGAAAPVSAATSTSAAGESSTSSEAYAGAHVDFAVDGNAITDYQVGGEELFSSVEVQSQSEADAAAGIDADASIELGALTALEGAGLSLGVEAETSAQVEAESGATLSAHDTERGTLIVESDGDGQYVEAEVAADAAAETDGDAVRVATDTHEGVFLVAGDGEVTVNDDGNVVAELEEDATLTFRAYGDGERDSDAEYEEELIADGTAAADIHVETRDGEAVADAATFGEETSAEVAHTAESTVEVTIDRAVHEGAIVMTTVSEEAVGSLEDIEVTVDGEAAVEASSESELESAIGGDRSAYKVANTAEAEGEATVYVAINHFSERTATIDGSDDGASDGSDDGTSDDGSYDDGTDDSDSSDDGTSDDTTDGSDGSDGSSTEDNGGESDEGSSDTVPGFGVAVAVIAVSLAGLLARFQH
ncbi:PGF-CTERM sorting domain-containing protein [Halopiger djelfimassiliensis]|uniref:PGF-CTERM sorting domain-containing protein n=1 Tax=Halopiger djelfimassiliensis TaxID=1293047 RepID=UPI0006782194|nr:PGF-CTERM sorting domain-containing protein [Halopiger djelfimassiliensis]